VSFLLAEGHADAKFYPLGMLAVEVEIARKRVTGSLVGEVALLRMAMASVMSKKVAREFKTEMERLSADAE